MMHFGTALLCVGLVGPTASLRAPMAAPAPRSPLRAARTPVAPRMVLGLPLGAPPGLGTLFGGSAGPEVLYDGRTPVDFEMETLHLTKRRCSGGVLLRDTSPEEIWAVLTNYERLPEVVPNILSNVVTRDGASGRVTIQQDSLLSTRLNLITSMVLEAVEDRDRWEMTLRRVSGHGFLEFEGKYTLTPRAGGATYLSYSVELVPCPIFPLPLVERKIRKEVPKMLCAVGAAAVSR